MLLIRSKSARALSAGIAPRAETANIPRIRTAINLRMMPPHSPECARRGKGLQRHRGCIVTISTKEMPHESTNRHVNGGSRSRTDERRRERADEDRAGMEPVLDPGRCPDRTAVGRSGGKADAHPE